MSITANNISNVSNVSNFNNNINLVDASAVACKKVVHLVKKVNDKDAVRRIPFNPAVHLVFRGDVMFLPNWETSSVLELFMPEGTKYAQLTVKAGKTTEETENNVHWFESVAQQGYRFNDRKRSIFRILFADWDDDGSAIMVDAAGTIKTLADLGLHTLLKNDADAAKLRKYMRRVLAHHEWALKGSLTDVVMTRLGKKAIVNVAGQEFEVLHVEFEHEAAMGNEDVVRTIQGVNVTNQMFNTALSDGIHIIDEDLCKILGKLLGNEKLASMKEGDAFKGTCLTVFGLGKGFFHVMKNCKHGITVFGSKKQVSFDHFFLGSLGDVKAGDAYTCLQSMINFDYWKNDVVYNQVVSFAKEVQESMEDEQKMRHLFLTHIAPVAEILGKDGEAGREVWVLIEALRKGVSLRKHPGLRRRVRRHLLTHVLNTAKGRVPFQSFGARFNLQPDLNCFRNAKGVVDGSVDWNRSSLEENKICCTDLNVGFIAMFRQPSGHKLERVITKNVHDRRFRRFRGHNRVVMGAAAWLYLRIMGGGDMDDSVIAIDDARWIELIANTQYPFTELPKAV